MSVLVIVFLPMGFYNIVKGLTYNSIKRIIPRNKKTVDYEYNINVLDTIS